MIIGAGPAGYVCAIRLAQLSQKVTVVEKEFLGGTCLNVGCIPSKAMIAAGALLERIHEATAMGITVEGVKLDLARLVAWKSEVVNKLTSGVGGLLKEIASRPLPRAEAVSDGAEVKRRPRVAAIVLAAPVLAAVGAFAALVTECTIEVEKVDRAPKKKS